MDLRGHLLALVAPIAIGDELLPGARLAGASTELGLRLTFDVSGADVHVEISPGEERRPHAAKSARLGFAYRSAGGDSSVAPGVGLALCRAVAQAAAGNESAVLAAIVSQAQSERQSVEHGTRVRTVRVERLLEPAGFGDARYFTLSPYVGCLIGCRFCYAQSRVASVRRLERLPETSWGSFVDVRVNAPEVLARELATLPRRPLKFCPIVSDPYQAVEQRQRVTRRCLETIRDAASRPPTLVLTRSAAIVEDAELLASIEGAYAGASIPTFDDSVRRHFEPRGASVPARLDALRTLAAAGVRTFAVVQPMLPGPVDAFADALADVARSVSLDVLHGVEDAAAEFADARYAFAQDEGWQRERAAALAGALAARGVEVWPGELPQELVGRG